MFTLLERERGLTKILEEGNGKRGFVMATN
jgi:hypothetical protein